MSDILGTLNNFWPNTAIRYAPTSAAFPSGSVATPCCGGYVELVAGATLPADATITAQFANYDAVLASAASAKTAQQGALAAIAAGIVITSTATPALNGTYPIDPATQVKLNSAVTYIMLNNAFPPALAASMPWYDASGTPHIFTAISDFKHFATAFADFVAHVDIYASSGGATGSIPSNAITIP